MTEGSLIYSEKMARDRNWKVERRKMSEVLGENKQRDLGILAADLTTFSWKQRLVQGVPGD